MTTNTHIAAQAAVPLTDERIDVLWKSIPKTQNIVQFAVEHGYATDADVASHIHANLRSMPTTKSHARRFDAALRNLQSSRDAGKAAYRSALADGSVVEPAPATLEERAAGHPDNPSTQAAIRLLAKRKALHG